MYAMNNKFSLVVVFKQLGRVEVKREQKTCCDAGSASQPLSTIFKRQFMMGWPGFSCSGLVHNLRRLRRTSVKTHSHYEIRGGWIIGFEIPTPLEYPAPLHPPF